MKYIHIGILSAMPQEIGNFVNNLKDIEEHEFGDLKIYSGFYLNQKNKEEKNIRVSLAWSGWGKVSAARAATRLISLKEEREKIDLLIFSGVAGSACPNCKQWDVIVGEYLIQYDMDARPLFPKYFIPALNADKLHCSKNWFDWAFKTLQLSKFNNELNNFGSIKNGLIGTADLFISDKKVLDGIKKEIPDLKAIEMEGASVAQIAIQENIPWIVIRVISDSADDSAPQIFDEFIKKYTNSSFELLSSLLENINNGPKLRS